MKEGSKAKKTELKVYKLKLETWIRDGTSIQVFSGGIIIQVAF